YITSSVIGYLLFGTGLGIPLQTIEEEYNENIRLNYK
ncbi:hypothetical protein QRX48_03080, partial [Staphylococcus warneri]